jgi:hypothetical protein
MAAPTSAVVGSQVAEFVPAAQEFAGELLVNPATWNAVSDFASGFTPGPVSTISWATLTGLAASEIIYNWSDISQAATKTYQYLKEEVPH